MILPDGTIAVLLARTTLGGRRIRARRVELAQAVVTSPLSRGADGIRVGAVFVQDGLDRLSPAWTYYVLRQAQVLDHCLRHCSAERVFRVLPDGAGPTVLVGVDEYMGRLQARRVAG